MNWWDNKEGKLTGCYGGGVFRLFSVGANPKLNIFFSLHVHIDSRPQESRFFMLLIWKGVHECPQEQMMWKQLTNALRNIHHQMKKKRESVDERPQEQQWKTIALTQVSWITTRVDDCPQEWNQKQQNEKKESPSGLQDVKKKHQITLESFKYSWNLPYLMQKCLFNHYII